MALLKHTSKGMLQSYVGKILERVVCCAFRGLEIVYCELQFVLQQFDKPINMAMMQIALGKLQLKYYCYKKWPKTRDCLKVDRRIPDIINTNL